MLDISLTGVLWTMVNVFVLFLLLKKFLWKPVTRMIESRQEEIENNLSAASSQRAEAQAAKTQYEERLLTAAKDAEALVQNAKERGELEYQQIVKSAQSEAHSLTVKAEEQIEADRSAMLADVRTEVAMLALITASKVAGRRMDSNDDRAIADAFLSEVGETV